MSQITGGPQNDTPTRRSERKITRSRRAEELFDSGEALPGLFSEASTGFEQSEGEDSTTSAAATEENVIYRTVMPGPRGVQASEFAPHKFTIYFWEHPIPTNFLNLSASRKAWKRRTDQQESQADIDDGADDWHAFFGDRDQRVIARCFVKRAKRAFRAGKTWSEFEAQERSLDSEECTEEWMVPDEQLSNDYRLEIFDVLKRRLCEEIWLEQYREPGLDVLPLPRKDSGHPSTSSEK